MCLVLVSNVLSYDSLSQKKFWLKHIATRLQNVYAEAEMPSRMVRPWVERFKASRNNVHDDDRSGWPSDDETIAGILALFERD